MPTKKDLHPGEWPEPGAVRRRPVAKPTPIAAEDPAPSRASNLPAAPDALAWREPGAQRGLVSPSAPPKRSRRRPPFAPTHRVRVTTPGGDGDVPVQLDADREGFGPGWSGEAWDASADADFRLTSSRWFYVGSEAGIVVISGEKLPPVYARGLGGHGGRGRRGRRDRGPRS